KKTLFDNEDTKEADDGAEGGIEMDEPGEDQTPGHPADLRRGSGEAGPGLEPVDPGGGLAVFAGIDRDSKSLQQFEVGHEGDVGETKGARQVFVAVELGLDPVECLDDRCS